MNKRAATITKAATATGAVVLLTLAGIFGINQLRVAQAEQVAAEQQEQAAIEAQEAEFEALVVKFSSPAETSALKTPPAPPVVAPPAEEPVYVPEITYCPEGTVAGAVDAQGNESACQALSPEGEQCVAYDDANNCTQWYKP